MIPVTGVIPVPVVMAGVVLVPDGRRGPCRGACRCRGRRAGGDQDRSSGASSVRSTPGGISRTHDPRAVFQLCRYRIAVRRPRRKLRRRFARCRCRSLGTSSFARWWSTTAPSMAQTGSHADHHRGAGCHDDAVREGRARDDGRRRRRGRAMNRDDLLDTLRSTQVFGSLDPTALDELAAVCVPRTFRRDQFLWYQGDPGDHPRRHRRRPGQDHGGLRPRGRDGAGHRREPVRSSASCR